MVPPAYIYKACGITLLGFVRLYPRLKAQSLINNYVNGHHPHLSLLCMIVHPYPSILLPLQPATLKATAPGAR